MKQALFGMLAAVALVPVPSAFAVDIHNQDQVDHEVSLVTEKSEKKLVVKAGATAKDVCPACIVEFNDDNFVEAEKDQVVTIKKGRVLEVN